MQQPSQGCCWVAHSVDPRTLTGQKNSQSSRSIVVRGSLHGVAWRLLSVGMKTLELYENLVRPLWTEYGLDYNFHVRIMDTVVAG